MRECDYHHIRPGPYIDVYVFGNSISPVVIIM